MIRRLRFLVAAILALTLTGCATVRLTTPQTVKLAEMQAFADRISATNDLPRITLKVTERSLMANAAASAHPGGTIKIRRGILEHPMLIAVIAHEAAHFTLGHLDPRRVRYGRVLTPRERELQELDANTESVRLLRAVGGLEPALAVVAVWLTLNESAGLPGHAEGHPVGSCVEADHLLRNFSQFHPHARLLAEHAATRGRPFACPPPAID